MNFYYTQYRFSNIAAMLRNEKKDPIQCKEDFKGRLVVITGATSGIGYATALKFADHGADLLCINRSEERSEKLRQELEKRGGGGSYDYILADFSSLEDVHNAAEKLAALERPIDVLIHNAGVFMTRRTFTGDSLETVFQTNYLSSFILNYRLLEKFKKQNSGRIIFVNSEGHRFAVNGLHLKDLKWRRHLYTGLKSYGAAKTAQLLSLIKLDELYSSTGVTINAMHPGNVKSRMGENNGRLYRLNKRLLVDRNAKSPKISAEALYYLGVSREMENISGKFFNLTTEEETAPPARDRKMAEMLWNLSCELSGLRIVDRTAAMYCPDKETQEKLSI